MTIVQDRLVTETSQDQEECEQECLKLYNSTQHTPELEREKHVQFLHLMLGKLPGRYKSIDASRQWLLYWSCNALAMLGEDVSSPEVSARLGESVLAAQNSSGGLGGSFGQLSHLATSYAGITALSLCQNEAIWDRIDRKAMYSWLMSLKQPNGSFVMHIGGESDTRASYCALAVASLLGIMTEELVDGVGEYLGSCQTYEGGFGGTMDNEAHGGYAFCGLAALCLLGPPSEMLPKYIDVDAFVRWLSARQHGIEQGLSGRTNKLVDGCYNHWVGGCWALIENAIPQMDLDQSLWSRQGLQEYTLYCCQSPKGGLRDKPGKNPDAYHTNYTLCGMSGAQYKYRYIGGDDAKLGDYAFHWKSEASPEVQVPANSYVKPINPIHVVPEGVAEAMARYFKGN